MTANPNPDPKSPQRGTCLACGHNLDLLPGGAIPDHHRAGDSGEPDCPGRGFRPVQRDGRDDVRREAVRRFRAIQGETAVKLLDFQGSLTKGYRVRDAIEMDAGCLVVLEAEAILWRELAIHGQWLETTREAIRRMVRRPSTTSDVDRGMDALEAQGALAWLRTSRVSIQKACQDQQAATEALLNILFTI